MKWIPVAMALAVLPLSSGQAMAGAQQERMKQCNKEARTKSLQGDERKSFMKTCLSAGRAKAPDKRQAKLRDCTEQASGKGLKAEARRQFIDECSKA